MTRRLAAQVKAIIGDYADAAERGVTFVRWRARMLAWLKSVPSGDDGEDWAEDDTNLPRLERAARTGLVLGWRGVRDDTLRLMELPMRKAVGEVFRFDLLDISRILALGDEFARDSTKMDGPLTRAVWQSWVRGWVNAGAELDVDAAITDQLTSVRAQLQIEGFQLVRDGVARELRDKIVPELAAGAYDGLDPYTVAEQLRMKFGRSEYNWERLARSEIAMAQGRGKLEMYEREGIDRVDYVTAGDSRVSEICQALAAAGPYPIGRAPVPVRDSHPNCRCTLQAHRGA